MIKYLIAALIVQFILWFFNSRKINTVEENETQVLNGNFLHPAEFSLREEIQQAFPDFQESLLVRSSMAEYPAFNRGVVSSSLTGPTVVRCFGRMVMRRGEIPGIVVQFHGAPRYMDCCNKPGQCICNMTVQTQ
jgi:hypothetical protein